MRDFLDFVGLSLWCIVAALCTLDPNKLTHRQCVMLAFFSGLIAANHIKEIIKRKQNENSSCNSI